MSTSWCLVSDVDDTIKDTSSFRFFHLVYHTFFRQPVDLPGMAAAYGRLARCLPISSLTFLSASPVRAFPLFKSGHDLSRFPSGRIILPSPLQVARFCLSGHPAIAAYKLDRLMASVGECEERLICIGDVFQRDLEVYSDFFRVRSHLAGLILIRAPAGICPKRLARAQTGLPRVRCVPFKHAGELEVIISLLERLQLSVQEAGPPMPDPRLHSRI